MSNNKKVLEDRYDIRYPQKVYNNSDNMIGFGCTICDLAPPYCPYFDAGEECLCNVCDFNTKYKPTKIFKTRDAIDQHLQDVHKLVLSKE